jgi:hypothetical protein
MAIRTVIGFWVALIAVSQTVGGDAGEKVGGLGDLHRLDIRGAVAFSADDIKDQLWQSLDVQLAVHPKTLLSDCIATLDDKVSEGYRYGGFADVKVTTRVDRKAGRLVMNVAEGRRSMAGKIEVEGAGSIQVADLVQKLTTPRLKDRDKSQRHVAMRVTDKESGNKAELSQISETKDYDPPIWDKGKPAHLDRQTQQGRHKEIEDALADLGYLSTKFNVETTVDANGVSATLRIRFFDAGVQVVLDQVDVVGNRKNSRQEILDYLGLKDGEPIDRAECPYLRERLWLSGRFTKCELKPMPVFWHDAKQRLKIDVTEYEKAPRLSERLSPAEEAMLKCRKCLLDSSNWDGDLVYRDKPANYEIVISPTHGSLFVQYENAAPGKSPPLVRAVAAAVDEIGAYNAASGKEYAFSPRGKRVILDLRMILSNDRKDWDEGTPVRLMFGTGLNDNRGDSAPLPFELKLTLDPATALALADEYKAKCTVADNVITVRSTSHLWRLDATSGRVLEACRCAEDGKEPGVRITFEKGAFDRRLREIQAVAAHYANTYDPQRAFTTAGQFLAADEGIWNGFAALNNEAEKKVDPRVLRMARKLLAAGILAPLDIVINKWSPRDENSKFKIHNDNSFDRNGLAGFCAQCLLYVSNAMFPRDSWPWTLTQEAALSAVGKGLHSQAEIFELYASEESGPICCLAAGTFALWNNPAMAREFAAKGLRKLRLEDFRKDYRFLLQPNHPISIYVNEVAAALCALDDDEVALLLTKASPEQVRAIVEGLHAFRQRRDPAALDALPDLLDAMWQNGLQERVAASLENLAGGSVPWQANKAGTHGSSRR